MSVIGYDGRIRPASTPFNAGTPNKLDPEAIGRIGEAQPKFAEYATKLINSLGKNAVDYGMATAQKEKRMEDLQDRETVMNERQSIEEQKRAIQNSKTLTAEEKEWAGKNIVVRKHDTGNEERNKRIELDVRGAAISAMNSIIAEADNMKEAAEAAALGAFEAQSKAEYDTFIGQITPELLNRKDLDDLTEGYESASSEWFAKLEAGRVFSPKEKVKYDSWKASIKAGKFGQLAYAFNNAKLSRAQKDLTDVISSISVDAGSAYEVGAASSAALNGELVKNLYSDVQKQEVVNSAILNYSQNSLNELNASVATSTMAAQKAATAFLEYGDVKGYNDRMQEINEFVVSRYTNMISQLNDDENDALHFINSNSKISDEEQRTLAALVRDKYEKLRELAKSKMASEAESVRRDGQAAKTEAGTKAGKTLQKVLRGEAGGKLDPNGQKVYDLLQKGGVERAIIANALKKKESGVELSAEEKAIMEKAPSEELVRQFENIYAPNKMDGQKRESVLLGFESAIINATQDTEGNYNLLDIESVLKTCGEVYGYSSDEYDRVAKMAVYAIKNQKNGESETIDSWIQKDVYGKKTKDEWIKSSSHEQIRALNNLKLRLQETPKEQLESVYKALIDDFKTAEKFRMLESGEVFVETFKRASERAKPEAPYIAGGHFSGDDDGFWSRLLRTKILSSAPHVLGASLPSTEKTKQ